MAAHGTVWPAQTALTQNADNAINLAALNNGQDVHSVSVLNSRTAAASVFISYDTAASPGMIEVQPGQLWQDEAPDPETALLGVLHIYPTAAGVNVNGSTTGGVTVWAGAIQRGTV